MKQKYFLFFMVFMVSLPVYVFGGYNPIYNYIINPSDEAVGTGGNLTDFGKDQFMVLSKEDGLYGGYFATLHYSDYFRTGGFETNKASFERDILNSAYLGRGGKFPWQVALHSHHLLGSYRMELDKDKGFARSTNFNEAYGISGTVNYGLFHLTADMDQGKDEQFSAGASTIVVLNKNYQTGIAWKKQQQDLMLGAKWIDDEDELKIHGEKETLTGFLDVSPLFFLQIKGIINRHLWINSYDRVEDNDLFPTLYPWGSDNDYHGFVALKYEELQGAGGIRHKEMDLKARGYKGVGSFSKVAKAYLKSESEFVSITYIPEDKGLRLLLEAEQTDITSEVVGSLQFWPFTQGWISMFGLGRYGMGEANAKMYRYHFGAEKTIEDNLKLSAGLNFIDVFTSGDWLDYSSSFFEYDVNYTALDVFRAQIGMVSLGVERQNEGWTFKYEFNQLIPIRIWKHETVFDEVEPTPQGSSVSSKKSAKGGGFHRLTIGYSF